MKHINTFEQFLNESFLSDVKDFIKGIKTDDDRLAKNLLENVSKFTDVKRGYGRYELSYNFRFNGYLFELFDGYAYMYGPDIKDNLVIRSKFFQKLYSQVKDIVNKQETEENRKKAVETQKLKEAEFNQVLKKFGGIAGIADYIFEQTQKAAANNAFWQGQIRIDSNPTTLVMTAPINESNEARKMINTIVVNLGTGSVTMHQSYGAYADYKKYEGHLSSSELRSLDKYVQIAKDLAKASKDKKIEIIKNIINK